MLGACGGDGGEATTPPAAETGPGGGGALTYALAAAPGSIDPLTATTRSALVVTRQLHEPLVDSISPPFQERGRRSLALSWSPSSDRRVWRLRLRRGVRFQDGSPFHAEAVVANATRWRTTTEGRRLVPGLIGADAPRSAVARMVFDRPRPNLPRLLGSPRLGIVSPLALRPRDGASAELGRSTGTGTGPFELREGEGGAVVVLARFASWWGSRASLGPALDQIEFRAVESESRRAEMLEQGRVLVADSLGPAAAARVRRDPLLTVTPGPGMESVGMERSIRGLRGSDVQSLSSVWLADVGGA